MDVRRGCARETPSPRERKRAVSPPWASSEMTRRERVFARARVPASLFSLKEGPAAVRWRRMNACETEESVLLLRCHRTDSASPTRCVPVTHPAIRHGAEKRKRFAIPSSRPVTSTVGHTTCSSVDTLRRVYKVKSRWWVSARADRVSESTEFRRPRRGGPLRRSVHSGPACRASVRSRLNF